MLRTHYSNEVTPDLDNKKIAIAGWVRTIRDIGKTKFIIVSDRFGEIQVTVKKDAGKIFEQTKKLSREDVISVNGVVKENKAAPGGR